MYQLVTESAVDSILSIGKSIQLRTFPGGLVYQQIGYWSLGVGSMVDGLFIIQLIKDGVFSIKDFQYKGREPIMPQTDWDEKMSERGFSDEKINEVYQFLLNLQKY